MLFKTNLKQMQNNNIPELSYECFDFLVSDSPWYTNYKFSCQNNLQIS